VSAFSQRGYALFMANAGLMDRLLRATPAPVAGALRMVGAMGGDVARAADLLGVLDGKRPSDPLDEWDPDYVRETLPALRALSGLYFRATIRGLENIPADGPVLLVGNHSGGTLIADTFVFGQYFYGHFGPERRFHQLAHDLVFAIPGVRASLARYGTVPASPRNMERALDRGAALLVYPGGDHETYRPSWESSKIDFAGRTGFAELAMKFGCPVVPVVAIGGQGRELAKTFRLDQLLRVKVLPAQVAPPFGLTVLDLPGRIPLPAKITLQVLPPLDLSERLGAEADAEDAYRLVTASMQSTLDALAAERRLPVIG
jgi:1-acyl-sn-glycerol-3-phosphate acyltransferase